MLYLGQTYTKNWFVYLVFIPHFRPDDITANPFKLVSGVQNEGRFLEYYENIYSAYVSTYFFSLSGPRAFTGSEKVHNPKYG